MKKDKPVHALEATLFLLNKEAKGGALSIEKILSILSGKGCTFVIFVLSLPFCQPLQIPGLSLPFGLTIAFIGLRIAFGTQLWLPKRLLCKTIRGDLIEKITDKTLLFLKKREKWIRPRWRGIGSAYCMPALNGFLLFILGIFLALPMPILFSNLAAAWAIFFISLGLLEDHGLFLLIGYCIFLSTTSLFILLGVKIKQIFFE